MLVTTKAQPKPKMRDPEYWIGRRPVILSCEDKGGLFDKEPQSRWSNNSWLQRTSGYSDL